MLQRNIILWNYSIFRYKYNVQRESDKIHNLKKHNATNTSIWSYIGPTKKDLDRSHTLSATKVAVNDVFEALLVSNCKICRKISASGVWWDSNPQICQIWKILSTLNYIHSLTIPGTIFRVLIWWNYWWIPSVVP